MPSDPRVRALGQVLYEARIREAWGPSWINRPQWPAGDDAWRAYPHHPVAEIDLTLAQARAALAWFDAQSKETQP